MSDIRPHLRLIRGGRYRELLFGQTRLLVSERANPNADGYLFEEDTLLSMTAQQGDSRAAGGSAVSRDGVPAALLLIVNEGQAPRRFRPGWLDPAWKAALQEADRRKLTALSAPLIGCIGGADLDVVLLALASALTLERPTHLRSVELVCADLADEVYRRLARYAHSVRN